MCAMRMVGEASVTPSIAFEASQFHINVDTTAPFTDEGRGGGDDEDGKDVSRQDQINSRRKRRDRIAQYEANVSQDDGDDVRSYNDLPIFRCDYASL